MSRFTRWTRTTVNLPRKAMLGIEDGRGMRLEVTAGKVWLTQSGDLRDVFLGPGDGFVIDRAGRTLVQALDATELRLDAAFSRPPSMLARMPLPRSLLKGVA
jgi:Protein of unknown function (DUF2917)